MWGLSHAFIRHLYQFYSNYIFLGAYYKGLQTTSPGVKESGSQSNQEYAAEFKKGCSLSTPTQPDRAWAVAKNEKCD